MRRCISQRFVDELVPSAASSYNKCLMHRFTYNVLFNGRITITKALVCFVYIH